MDEMHNYNQQPTPNQFLDTNHFPSDYVGSIDPIYWQNPIEELPNIDARWGAIFETIKTYMPINYQYSELAAARCTIEIIKLLDL